MVGRKLAGTVPLNRSLSRHSVAVLAAWLCMAPVALAQAPAEEDVIGLQQKAMKAAVARVAPSVVQIETSGGSDIITPQGGPEIRKGVGPTTGLIVGEDGYIISSAFNFANKPLAIFVSVPGHKERYPAKVVAIDHTRMLTLLKVEAKGLPVPAAAPKKEIKVGQWALALGRTWSLGEGPPSVSVGIISALERIWGKAVQTDAKVSPVNYGGPLIDIQGRVQGVLVPASPRGEGEAAGVEWYDSGIGFAVPLEDINAVLPRLKEGTDQKIKELKRGFLGVTMKSPDIYEAVPVVASVAPESTAAKAGIKPEDTVLEIEGVKVVRQAQILHLLGNKYEGDVVSVKIKRGTEEISLPKLKLGGVLTSFVHPFLGILPLRDDPDPGVAVRHVYPKSPAETAGFKAGDRIMKVGRSKTSLQAFAGRDQLLAILNTMSPDTEITVERQRPGAKETDQVTLKLGVLPETIPDKLPEPASAKKALETPKAVGPKPPAPPKKEEKKEDKKEEKKEPAKKPETGLLQRTTAAQDHNYWVYVPDNYDPNISHALLIWLHPASINREKFTESFVAAWEDYCKDHHIIVVGPQAQNDRGWLFSEADFVQQAAREVMGQYTIDRQRVVAHGMAGGGQLAFYLGFHARDLIRGVATTGAVLMTQPKENVANQRLSFFLIAGEKDPLAKSIAESKGKLVEQKFPAMHREIAEMGRQYLDQPTLAELVRWIDALDRM